MWTNCPECSQRMSGCVAQGGIDPCRVGEGNTCGQRLGRGLGPPIPVQLQLVGPLPGLCPTSASLCAQPVAGPEGAQPGLSHLCWSPVGSPAGASGGAARLGSERPSFIEQKICNLVLASLLLHASLNVVMKPLEQRAAITRVHT